MEVSSSSDIAKPLDADSSDKKENSAANPDMEKELMPTTCCGHLQLIFALLQFSSRRYACKHYNCSFV